MTPNADGRGRRRGRPGFTLVELLVVMLVIAALVALLFPAINASIRAAHSARVSVEIGGMEQALTSFFTKYGDYPPSRVILSEAGAMPITADNYPSGPLNGVVQSGGDSTHGTTDITYAQLSARTVAAFRKFWPKVRLSTGGVWLKTGATLPSAWYDFNGDGAYNSTIVVTSTTTQDTSPYILQGHECLVFFLGGIPLTDSSNPGKFVGMSGFAKDPANPFLNSKVAPNRTPPLYDFVADRLTASTSYQTSTPVYATAYRPPAPYFFPGYLDSLASQSPANNFYAYFSNNLGRGYDPDDVNIENPAYELDASGTHPLTLHTLVNGQSTWSPSPNPYTTGMPSPPTAAASSNFSAVFQKPQSIQIISPGLDGVYGLGGAYSTSSGATSPLAPYVQSGTYAQTNSTDTNVRAFERDNVTNFHSGRLE